jgi:hypothetical protein
MVDDVQRNFERMESVELLATVSFFQIEYAPESLRKLKDVAMARGITDTAISQYRESCYPALDFEFKCGACGRELMLDRDEFINGSYICPECHSTNILNYMEIEPELSKAVGKAISEFAVIAGGSLAGAIILGARENKKRLDRRGHILDGSYWKALQEIAQAKSLRL